MTMIINIAAPTAPPMIATIGNFLDEDNDSIVATAAVVMFVVIIVDVEVVVKVVDGIVGLVVVVVVNALLIAQLGSQRQLPPRFCLQFGDFFISKQLLSNCSLCNQLRKEEVFVSISTNKKNETTFFLLPITRSNTERFDKWKFTTEVVRVAIKEQ